MRDPRVRWQLCMTLSPDKAQGLRALMQFLRDDPRLRFQVLLDVAGIDYLSFPNHRGPRFAVVYLLKSLTARHRIVIKAEVEEDACEVPSVTPLWRVADWHERETWDQFGIRFQGHPDLRRLLNHHEFVGHPLRKDYPVQKRQKLSINDPMLDQLESRLRAHGFTVLEAGEVHLGERISAPHEPAAAQGQVDAVRGQGDGSIDAKGL